MYSNLSWPDQTQLKVSVEPWRWWSVNIDQIRGLWPAAAAGANKQLKWLLMFWPSPGPARARRQDGSETICLSCSPARCELIIIFRPNRRCLWYYRIHLPPPTSQPPAHTSDWKYQIKAHILIVPSQYYRMEPDNLNKKMKNWFKIVQFYSICWQDWLTGAWLCLVKEKERERDIPSPAQPDPGEPLKISTKHPGWGRKD